MKIRVDGMGLVNVSDRHKRRLAELKRHWGAEAVYLRPTDDHKAIEARVLYTGIGAHIVMPILKGGQHEGIETVRHFRRFREGFRAGFRVAGMV
ncbi:MAG: hypothetical protein WCJ37_03645 [Syntrophus sp. (in: bacteria)]